MDDEFQEMGKEIVRVDLLDKAVIGLDFSMRHQLYRCMGCWYAQYFKKLLKLY